MYINALCYSGEITIGSNSFNVFSGSTVISNITLHLGSPEDSNTSGGNHWDCKPSNAARGGAGYTFGSIVLCSP